MADRIIEKALLIMFICGITSVYGCIISDCAKNILEDSGIHTEHDEIVPYIMNGIEPTDALKLVDNIGSPKHLMYFELLRKNP